MGIIEGLIEMNQKAWIPHSKTSLPWHFFVVNDSSKLNPTFFQTMHCTICHFVSHAYNYGSTTKKRNGLITYGQQHGTTSMKKHVTSKHGNAWAKWKSVNLNLATKDDKCRKKSKHRSVVGYGAITYQFGNITPYKKEDLGKQKFMEDLLMFVAKGYMPISVVGNQSLNRMVLCQNP
jgi:hypothetical protein